MSEPTITKETPKPKDPRKVEAGKRLAAISKEAKAKAKKVRENAEVNLNTSYSSYWTFCAGALVVAVGGLVYFLKPKTIMENIVRKEEEVSNVAEKSKTKFETFNN